MRELSVPQRRAVLARVGAAAEHAARMVDPYRLATADGSIRRPGAVTECGQLARSIGRNTALDFHLALIGKHAWRFERLLHVHAEIEQIAEHMRVADRLI